MNYSEEQIERLIEEIYKGNINPLSLPVGLYLAVGRHLEKAVYKGYGAAIKAFEFGSPDYVFLSEVRENVYLFSAAKNFQFTLSTANLIIEDDEIVPLAEFKRRARKNFDLYNDAWLEAEHTTAILQGEAAANWKRIEEGKKLFPYLRYETVGDTNVSQVCLQLEGVVKKVDDPFWRKHAPLNHYNCRCHLERIDYLEEVTETDTSKLELVDPPKAFQHNIGTSKQVFTKEHPYFDVPKKYKAFAKTNFGLDIPELDE